MNIEISVIEENQICESDVNIFLDLLLKKFEIWMDGQDERS